MAEPNIRFTRGFTLEDALAMLEDDEETSEKVETITIFPPENAAGELTDEDSGEEEVMNIGNLPGSQLKAPAELHVQYNDSDEDFVSEDDLPLSEFNKKSSKSNNTPKQKKKKKYHWVKEDLPIHENEFPDCENFTNVDSPLDIFTQFFDEELIQLITTESNRYIQQKNRKNNIDSFEIKSFIGILILSGYVTVPKRRMYWEREKDGHNDLVAESLSRDRFEYILTNIHFQDNQNLDQSDKFAKVRPLFNFLNKKFMAYAFTEQMHSVDEAMVPYFGRHGCKQFIHSKPIRYGYKLWAGSTRLGYINWFEPYQGSSTNISKTYAELGVGAGVVLEYADALRKKWPDSKFHIFFDNFFTSLPLIEELTNKNFYATGTVRENRLPGNSLINSKLIKKQKRGTYDYQKVSDRNIIAVKWHDNSVVSLCSNVAGVAPIHFVKRYSQKEKRNIQVEQPHLINLYNANMGGVDRSDQNISLYRISIRGKKWYFPLITHAIDMAIQNSWQIHRKKEGLLDQLSFRRRIATSLLEQNKKKFAYQRGRPSTSQGADLRYDRLDHLVIPQEKQTRCGQCHERAKTRCLKCNVGLHTKCFVPYHTKN